jgi:hypothetical protein
MSNINKHTAALVLGIAHIYFLQSGLYPLDNKSKVGLMLPPMWPKHGLHTHINLARLAKPNHGGDDNVGMDVNEDGYDVVDKMIASIVINSISTGTPNSAIGAPATFWAHTGDPNKAPIEFEAQ